MHTASPSDAKSVGRNRLGSFARPKTGSARERRIIAILQSAWRGPALSIRIENRSYAIGQGPVAAEMVVQRSATFLKLWRNPVLLFGEAYTRGELHIAGSLASFLEAVYLSKPEELSSSLRRSISWLRCLPTRVSPQRAAGNARHHYNIGNDFFRLWLDPSLTYSCAYFLRDSDSLATAQRQKLELLCQKARLAPGQTLLDVGCGWGSLLVHAARFHGVRATGITPVEAQADYIEALARREGVADRVHVRRIGWRAIEGKFDRIISVGMFEHVGLKQYRHFFRRWRELLADGGLSVLHCIGRMKPTHVDPWIIKYIFPGGYLPTLAQLAAFSSEANLSVLDVENLRQHYARTLDCWMANFKTVFNRVAETRGPEFARMWWLYLNGAYAGFRWGDLQLWQVVFAKDENHRWPLNRQVDIPDHHADEQPTFVRHVDQDPPSRLAPAEVTKAVARKA
ncbi:MAG TPA: cyclopropane-fatty-acyl-phospholipid synthase family protein [Lacipirellulaceae bacterium]|nr:cyclopropane-fatty-acyl-phospholipid synthase family protein [Lacipirellulaceae bacterium]